MKNGNKSLRQLAKELGVSHSYLSQVKNGKRPVSSKIAHFVPDLLTTSHKMVSNNSKGTSQDSEILCYNKSVSAELCSGSTGDFGSSSPGSNPGSAATVIPQ